MKVPIPKSADVYAWGMRIGRLAEIDGKIYFEYDKSNNIDFSPISCPLIYAPQEFSSLAHQKGLPGFISDVLPGKYGQSYLNHFFESHFGHRPSPIEELLFLGDNALGVLEFRPSAMASEEEDRLILSMQELREASRNAIKEGESDYSFATLIALTNSAAGGARAKVTAGFRPEDKKIYVGHKHKPMPKSFHYAIIKLDEEQNQMHSFLGLSEDEVSISTKIEYIYSQIAREAGIHMPKTWLIEDEAGCHFGIERFDHTTNKRFHMHSLAGLHHNDASSFSMGYEMLFRTGLRLGISAEGHEQIFKVMLFNLLFGNRDDHTKNFSFLMDGSGVWSFSPAYDLTFAEHKTGANWHQMTINKKPAHKVKRWNLAKIAKDFRVNNWEEIIDTLIELKHTRLPELLKEHGVSQQWYQRICSVTEEVEQNIKREGDR